MSLEIAIGAVVVAGVVGWWLRGVRARRESREQPLLEALAERLESGQLPVVEEDDPAGFAAVCDALGRHWIARNEEREQALREALGRIAAFLREGVRDPLTEALSADRDVQREAIETAVGAIHDLEFFLRDPITPDEMHNLAPVVQQVAREFTQDWDITVRLRQSSQPVRAHIHRDSFMDAVYLLLHNAGQFGGDGTIDVTVEEEEGEAVVLIRDRGPGFSEEALERAHDLFYTTTETGLGLGIPFARKTVESFGGSLDIENLEDGGARVRLAIPSA